MTVAERWPLQRTARDVVPVAVGVPRFPRAPAWLTAVLGRASITTLAVAIVPQASIRQGLTLWATAPGALQGDPGDAALLDATLSAWLPSVVARSLLSLPLIERVEEALRLLDGHTSAADEEPGSSARHNSVDWPGLLAAYAEASHCSVAETLRHPWRGFALYTQRARAIRAASLGDFALVAQAAQSADAVQALNSLIAERTAVLSGTAAPKTLAEKHAHDRAALSRLAALLGGRPTA